jgi:hypothetical protein
MSALSPGSGSPISPSMEQPCVKAKVSPQTQRERLCSVDTSGRVMLLVDRLENMDNGMVDNGKGGKV